MYKDIECNKKESPDLFKAQLFALTGVLPERQKVSYCTFDLLTVCFYIALDFILTTLYSVKVMVKGKTLGDSWDTFPVTNNATILMMGSKEEAIPTGPSETVKFMEDMNEAEIATAVRYLTLQYESLNSSNVVTII